MIYFDNAATTKPCAEAVSVMCQALKTNWANPSSLHGLGLNAEQAVSLARDIIAKALSADSECIYFTSGATESNNLSIFSTAKTLGRHKKKIVTTTIEHPSVSQPIKYLEENGFEVVRISPDESGEIKPADIISAVDDNTCLVTCQLVNNETGYILPIAKAYKAIKRLYPKVITHCDCVQGFMKLNINANNLNTDLISLSGHKIYGPKGIGALYIKKGVRVLPVNYGGGQEKGIRSGTEAVPNIVGFGEAVKTFSRSIDDRHEKMCELFSYLEQQIRNIDGVSVKKFSESSPYIASVTVDNIKSETLLHYLEQRGIYVSSGSACSKGKKSDVLKAFNYSDKALDTTLRLSFSHENQKCEIDEFIKQIENAKAELVKMRRAASDPAAFVKRA